VPRNTIGIPEQLEPRRTREFHSTAKPTILFLYRDTNDVAVNVSGAQFRASLHSTAAAVATYTVIPTVTNGPAGEITVATVSGASSGRQQVFRVRRWDSGDNPAVDNPRGVYEERWDIPA